MTHGCQKSLKMKGPFFWVSQSTLLSSYRKMWIVYVLFDLNLSEDDNIMENGTLNCVQPIWWQIRTLLHLPQTALCVKKIEFWKLWEQNSASKPHRDGALQRDAAEPQLAALPHLSQAKSQLWTLVSQGPACHILTSSRHCCCLALVLLLLWFKVNPGAFLKCIFIRARIGIAKSQNVQN